MLPKFATAVAPILPLPKGEGRGEGEFRRVSPVRFIETAFFWARPDCRSAALINTPLQRGDRALRAVRNCFNSFHQMRPSPIHRFNGSPVHRFSDSPIPRFNAPTVHRFHDSTIQRFNVLTILLLLLTAPAALSRADELAEKGRAVFKKNQHAVVTVQLVLKSKFSMAGTGGQSSESRGL